MTTNKEWLFSLPLDEQLAWLDSEHMETQNGTLDGDTAALNAKIAELEERSKFNRNGWAKANIGWANANAEAEKLQAQVDKLTAERERYRALFGKALDFADEIISLGIEINEGIA